MFLWLSSAPDNFIEEGVVFLSRNSESVLSPPCDYADFSLILTFCPSFSSSSAYPEITSDAERHDYKREFDTDLREYKRLCAEMDDINDHLNKLSRQLDTLDDTSAKYQVRYTLYSP